jgi:UDP-3-O-acyl N-acetylglucosamine deacetylase
MSWPAQRLTAATEFSGHGVHLGEPCRVRVEPAPEGQGCWLQQGDVRFPALAENVVELERCTVLGHGSARVSTVEHLFAALAALRVYDCTVVVDGPELPILDGSALPFFSALASRVEAAGTIEPLVVTEPVWVGNENSQVLALPAEQTVFRYALFYPHPLLGYQECEFAPAHDMFAAELAPARTFALQQEVEYLQARGLARGGSLDNALVVGMNGYSTPLRLPNEPVRHKCLDLLGDLYLLGRPLQAQVIAIKAGHRWHVELVRKISLVRGGRPC